MEALKDITTALVWTFFYACFYLIAWNLVDEMDDTKYKSIKKFVNGLILMHLLLIFIGFILGLIAFQGTGYTFVGIPDGILFDTYPRCYELNFLCRILNGIVYVLIVFTFPLKLAIKFFAFIL